MTFAVTALLRLERIVKRFPGVVALNQVDFDLFAGEVHVLFGENGSGKSTLVNVITGVYPRDAGRFICREKEVQNWSPQQALAVGISAVFQEFSLVPDMTVGENLFLGREWSRSGFLSTRGMRSAGRYILDELNFELKLDSRVGLLSRADQQMTEIAKALLQDVKVLILDEPTASLTDKEARRLFAIIEQLKNRGVGIIYVSHRMGEIRMLSDRVTVLRDGVKIDTVRSSEVSDIDLVEMMTGRKIEVLFPEVNHKPGPVALEVKKLSVENRLTDIDLHVCSGEIVGLAGLAGHGKSAVARAVFGLERMSSGQVIQNGHRIAHPVPAAMLKRGVFYLPSDRAAEGLALVRPVMENVTMASLDLSLFSVHSFLRRRQERREVRKLVEKLSVRPERMDMLVKFLSGGNQQKVVLARGLSRASKVFLFDDPTVGVDVGAKKEVYLLLKQLAEEGAAVLFISSELIELLHLCHRVYVVHRGKLAAEYSGDDITERNILSSFFDVEVEADAALSHKATG